MAGLAILKHTHDLSDEVLCERWVENPYYQFFCGEEFFQHRLVFDRSSLTRWRQRMGEEKLEALIQESLSIATRTKAIKPSELSRVIVDTTVQPKNVMFPTDAKLLNRAREILVRLAGRHGVDLRQSYERVGKYALIKHQRYAHAKQFKRANRGAEGNSGPIWAVSSATSPARSTATRLAGCLRPLAVAGPKRVRDQKQHQRGYKDLLAACAGGGVHRQGQGTQALRVRRQGLGRHDPIASKRRPVRHPCEGDARQAL